MPMVVLWYSPKLPCHSRTFLGLRAFARNTSNVSQFVEDIKNRSCRSSFRGRKGFGDRSKVAGGCQKAFHSLIG